MVSDVPFKFIDLRRYKVVFGELVEGMAWAKRINKLATPSGHPDGEAKIVDAGQIGWMQGEG